MAFFSGFRRLFDPDRLAVTQSLIDDDYGAAATMAERFRKLQADRERLSNWGKVAKRPPRFGQADEMSDLTAAEAASMTTRFDPQRTGILPAMLEGAQGIAGAARQASSPPNRGGFLDDALRSTQDAAAEAAALRAKGINGYGYMPTAADVNWLARALYSEFGRFNNWQHMPAGAATMINRVRPNGRWPSWRNEIGPTLVDVLETTNPDGTQQYSFMPPGGVHAADGTDQWQESAHPERLTGDSRKAWDLAHATARAFLEGRANDPTGGATYFRHRSAPEDRFWRSLVPSAYRSPNGENFFYHVRDEPAHSLPPPKPLIRGHSPRVPSRK